MAEVEAVLASLRDAVLLNCPGKVLGHSPKDSDQPTMSVVQRYGDRDGVTL